MSEKEKAAPKPPRWAVALGTNGKERIYLDRACVTGFGGRLARRKGVKRLCYAGTFDCDLLRRIIDAADRKGRITGLVCFVDQRDQLQPGAIVSDDGLLWIAPSYNEKRVDGFFTRRKSK